MRVETPTFLSAGFLRDFPPNCASPFDVASSSADLSASLRCTKSARPSTGPSGIRLLKVGFSKLGDESGDSRIIRDADRVIVRNLTIRSVSFRPVRLPYPFRHDCSSVTERSAHTIAQPQAKRASIHARLFDWVTLDHLSIVQCNGVLRIVVVQALDIDLVSIYGVNTLQS